MRLAFAALAGGAFRAPALDCWISPLWAVASLRPVGGASVLPASGRSIPANSGAADFLEGGAA